MEPIRHLYITLRKSKAGVRHQHLAILEALGLRKRLQTVKQPNRASVRGALDKIKYLVDVDTDEQYQARRKAEERFRALRRPLHFRHAQVPVDELPPKASPPKIPFSPFGLTP